MQNLLLPAHTHRADNDLALAARHGNPVARNTLYLRHKELIRNRTIPAQRLADKLEATLGAPINGEDVEQECFLIFCRFLEIWDPTRTPFVAFLSESIPQAAYAYVRTMQHLRSTRVSFLPMPPTEDPETPEHYNEADPEPQHDSALARALVSPDCTQEIISKDLWASISANLPLDTALVLHSRFWQDKSAVQIANATSRSLRAVNRMIRAALTTLQADSALDSA